MHIKRKKIDDYSQRTRFGYCSFFDVNKNFTSRLPLYTIEDIYIICNDPNAVYVSLSWYTGTNDTSVYDVFVSFSEYDFWKQYYDYSTLFNVDEISEFISNRLNEEKKMNNIVSNESEITFKRIIEFIDGCNAFGLGFITDLHCKNNDKYKAIKYLEDSNRIIGANLLVNGGDIGLDIGETSDEAFELIMKIQKRMAYSNVPYIMLKGNHDAGTQNIPVGKLNSYFNRQQETIFQNLKVIYNNDDNSKGMYGYIDYPNNKIRVMWINTSEVNYHDAYMISYTQNNWIVNTLKDTPNDYGVIVITHMCIDDIGKWNSYPDYTNKPQLQAFKSILTDFANHRSGNNIDIGISWDFTNCTSTLICNLCGDSHFNNYIKRDNVNVIVRQGYGTVSDSEIPSGATMAKFDYNEQVCFDYLFVKPNGEAKVFRVGAGGADYDLQFTY